MPQSFARFRRLSATTVLLTGLIAGVGVASAGGPAGAASNEPVTIALITSQTGQAGAEFQDSPQGFLARVALQNSQGGINGHRINTIILNDQTSPAQVVTAAQQAISQNVTGIVSVTPLFFLAAKYPNQAGMPVTGGSFDGPEWGTQPYTNMFASDTGSIDPKYPVNTQVGGFLKAHGGTVIGSYGYGISPSSTRAAVGTAQAFTHAGGRVGVVDTAIPFGSVDMTTQSLVAKQKNVDAVWAGMDNNTNFALAQGLKNAGVKTKAIVFPTGYEADLIKSPAWQGVQGAYFFSGYRPTTSSSPGLNQMTAALQRYEHRSPANFPTFNIYEAWLGADLMIQGLLKANGNFSHANVVKSLRSITNYTAGGILPVPINYPTIFGHDLPKSCQWYFVARPNGFVPVPGAQPWCGTDIPGTSVANAGSS